MKNIFKNLLSGLNPWDLFALKLRTLSENKNSLKPYVPASVLLLNLFFYSFIPILWIWVVFSWIIKQNRIKEFRTNNVSFWIIIAWIKSILKTCLKSAFLVQIYLTIACILSSFFLLRKLDPHKRFVALSLENTLPALRLPSQNLSWQTLEHLVGKQKRSKINLSNLSVFDASSDKNKLFLSVPEINFRKSEILDKKSTVKNTSDYNNIDQIDVFRDSIWLHFSSNWNKEQQQIFIGLYPHKIHQKSKSIQQQVTNKVTGNLSLKLQKQKTKHYSGKSFKQLPKQTSNVSSVSPFTGKLRSLKNLSKDKNKKGLPRKALSFSFSGKQVSNWSQIYARDWMGLSPEVKQNPQKNIFNGFDKALQLKDWLQSWYSSLDEFPTKLSQNYKSVKRDNFLDSSGLKEVYDVALQKDELFSTNNLPIQKTYDKHTKKTYDKHTPLKNGENKLENLLVSDNKQTRLTFYKKYHLLQNEFHNLPLKNKFKTFPFFEWFEPTKIKNSKTFGSNELTTKFFGSQRKRSLKTYKRKVLFTKLFSGLKPRAMSGYLYPDMERKQIETIYLQSFYRKGFKPVSWFTDTNTSTNRKSSSKLGVGLPVKTKLPSSFLSEFTLKFGNFIVPKLTPTPKLNPICRETLLLGIPEKDPTKQNEQTKQIEETEETEEKLLVVKILSDTYGIVTDSITKDIKISNSNKISNLAFDFFSIENPLSLRKFGPEVKRFIKRKILKQYLKKNLATLKGYRQDFDSILTLMKEKIDISREYEDFSDIFNTNLSNELYQDVSKIESKSVELEKKQEDIARRHRHRHKNIKPSNFRKKDTTKHPDKHGYKINKLIARIGGDRNKFPLLPYEETRKIAYLPIETWAKFIKINQPAFQDFIERASKVPLTEKLPSRKVLLGSLLNRLLYECLPVVSIPTTPSGGVSTNKNKEQEEKDPAKRAKKIKINKQYKKYFANKEAFSNFVEWPLTSLDRQTFPWSFLDSQRNSHLFLESTGISSKILPKITIHYFPYLQTLSTFTPFEVTSVKNTLRSRRPKITKHSPNLFQTAFFKNQTQASLWLEQVSGVKKKKKRVAYEPLTKYSWMVSFKIVCFAFFAKMAIDHYNAYAKESVYAFVELLLKTGAMSEDFIEELNLIPVPDKFRLIEKLETRFRDIAGIDNLLPLLGRVVWFFRNKGRSIDPKLHSRIPTGILLVGPPGTGKTFLVQAIAGESEVPVLVQAGSNFYRFSKKGKVLTGNRPMKSIFAKARELSPCIIFIDELDSVGASRGKIVTEQAKLFEKERNSHHLHISKTKQYRYSAVDWEPEPATYLQKVMKPKGTVRTRKTRKAWRYADALNSLQKILLGQLLIEMDGFRSRKEGVLVIGATNRPAILDEALLRFGRFSHIIHLHLPPKQKRIEILKLYTKNLGIQQSLSWDYFAELTTGWSASEIASAINESSMHAIIHDTVHTVETMERGIEIMSNLITQTGKLLYGNLKDPFRVTRRAFYQAGKALVSSILVEHPRLVMLHLWPRPTNTRQNRRLSSAPQINSQITRRPFEIRLIGFYAGKASELLVLGGNNLKQGKVSTTGLDKQKNAIFKGENHSLSFLKNYSNEIESVATIVPVSSVSNFYKAKRFISLYKGLAYFKINGEKKDLKSVQYLLYSKKNKQFGGTFQNTWDLKTNFSFPLNNFRKMVVNSGISRITFWHSDLGTDDLSAASSLASLMIEKWFFYSKTIAGRSMIRVLTDLNHKSFPVLRGYKFQKIRKMKALVAENDDILSFKKFQSESYQRNQEWYPYSWWRKEARKAQKILQRKTKTKYAWFKIYVLIRKKKALRNREWVRAQAFFHPKQALKNCLPKSRNVDVPFKKLYNFDRDYIYHGLLLKSFHKAFLLLDKNRELLDYFADVLIRSEILRENEIINIVSTFGYSLNQNKILVNRPK